MAIRTPEVKKLIEFLNNEMLKGTKKKIREDSGIGIKPMSPFGTKRLVRRAIGTRWRNGRNVVTLVHKGNIRSSPKARFAIGVTNWRPRSSGQVVTERESWILDNKDRTRISPSSKTPA